MKRRAFTLVELLVSVAIISVLLSLLLPSLGQARRQARVVRAHADLRQVCVALEAYAMDNRDRVPPTRQSCAENVQFQLPIELAKERYFAAADTAAPQAAFYDTFAPAQTYAYRTPGAVWQNGQFFDFPSQSWMPRAQLWVPDDVPACRGPEGRYYADRTGEPPSPVTYAVWSIGPDPLCPRFPRVSGYDDVIETARFPLSRAWWRARAAESGLIVHFRGRGGLLSASP